MTLTNQLILKHNKNIAYLQLLEAIVIAILAAQIFGFFKIDLIIFGKIIVINNVEIGFVFGGVGWYFFRQRLKTIESDILIERN